MLKTPHIRLQRVKIELKKSQSDMALVMGIKQPAYSLKEKGERKITSDEAARIEDELGVRAEWLLYGKGEMYVLERQNERSELREPDQPMVIDEGSAYGLHAQRARFIEQVERYCMEHHTNYKDTATALHVSPNYLYNVKNGYKEVPLSMLVNACRYGKFNLNFTITGKGDLFLDPKLNEGMVEFIMRRCSEEVESLNRELADCREIISTQKSLLEELKKNKSGAKSSLKDTG